MTIKFLTGEDFVLGFSSSSSSSSSPKKIYTFRFHYYHRSIQSRLFLCFFKFSFSSEVSVCFWGRIREREKMEGGKQSGSSFATDLFGAKGSSSAAASSSGVLDSIFAPPSRVSGAESLRLSETEKKKHDFLGHSWNGQSASVSDKNGKSGQERSQSTKKNSYNYEEQKSQPFHYSSSIYYGGQDVYSQPQSAQNPSATTFSKDVGGDDDSGSASRGNWWQGSLYY